MLGRGPRLILAAIAALPACQNEYPLEPTPCDEWCDATRGFMCGDYDPAECVAHCELTLPPVDDRCREPLSDLLRCYRASFDIVAWCNSGSTPCEDELRLLESCAG